MKLGTDNDATVRDAAPRMNKQELVANVSVRLDMSKRVATDAVDAVLDVIVRGVAKGEKVTIPGFGTFERRLRSPRTARNPRTGERVVVPATPVVVFRAGSELRRKMAATSRANRTP